MAILGGFSGPAHEQDDGPPGVWINQTLPFLPRGPDTDEVPGGQGPFGLPTNPIPASSSASEAICACRLCLPWGRN